MRESLYARTAARIWSAMGDAKRQTQMYVGGKVCARRPSICLQMVCRDQWLSMAVTETSLRCGSKEDSDASSSSRVGWPGRMRDRYKRWRACLRGSDIFSAGGMFGIAWHAGLRCGSCALAMRRSCRTSSSSTPESIISILQVRQRVRQPPTAIYWAIGWLRAREARVLVAAEGGGGFADIVGGIWQWVGSEGVGW